MKKFMLLIVTILLLGAVVLPAAAVPLDDLTTLAGYFPEGSVVYASARTDDDFIVTLDNLVAQVGQALPEVSGITLSDALDMLAAGIKSDSNFQELFGSWLGDTAAFGVYPMTMTDQFDAPIVVVAISITDREAAEAFFNSVTRPRDYNQTIGEGFTTYEDTRGNTNLLFRDDVILISTDFATIENGGEVDAPLNQSDAFNSTLGLLPETDYNAAIYMDTPALLNYTIGMSAALDSDLGASEQMIVDLLDAVQPQAFGLTILDETSLVIDAVTATNTEAMGMGAALTTPLDLSFVERIPAGTPLVVLGTNFGDTFTLIQDLLEQTAAMQGMDSESQSDMGDVQTAIWGLEFVVRGFTGLDLQDQILPAINGTYAMYAGINPAAENATNATELLVPDLLLDFALAFQVTDAAAATTLRDNLNATLRGLPAERQDNINISFEDINGTEVTVIGVETSPNFSDDRVELLIGVTEDVFVFGTRRFVEAAVNPEIGLDQDPQWQEALQYVVPNSYSMLYQSSDNFEGLDDLLIRERSFDLVRIGTFLNALTELVSSSSISYGTNDDRTTWTRAVLTLNGGE